jgi:hypothetical protein
MINFFGKLIKLPWLFCQPLTKKPKNNGDPVSELFIWRNSSEWVTYFELFDLASLFEENEENRNVILIFFKQDGEEFKREKIKIDPNTRNTINISEYVSSLDDQIGTFCVFHETPKAVKNIGSFIADRGYVSYEYKKSPLRFYVHGNLDAVSYSTDHKLFMLGGHSFLKRKYFIQYELSNFNFELAFVNPTNSNKHLVLKQFKNLLTKPLAKQAKRLKPREVCIFFVKGIDGQIASMTSNLVMARPIVFRFSEDSVDVFHG